LSGTKPFRAVLVLGLLAACGAGACTGLIGDTGESGPEGPSAQTLGEIGETGLRRLTATEYDATIFDLLGVVTQSETALPEDLRSPFDNDYTKQQASAALISAADVLAGDIAEQVAMDDALRAKVVPCTPTGADDAACFREFLATFGRRAFRRPLATEELDHFATLLDHGIEENDFRVAVASALRAFLEHPYFLYRVEIGTPVEGEAGVFRLTDFELATRLSYTVWGSTPPDWLLDSTEQGGLAGADGVRAAVAQLLEDDRAKARIARFHSMWLGYERLPHAADLAAGMQLETGKLLERVIFDQRGPWVDLLRSTDTYLTTELAQHYGLPAPAGGEGWVDYGDSGRQGLLSQGSFLSAVAKFDDTSPTQRGLLIRTRLFCQAISPPPPDLMVNTDMPPEGPDPNACKPDRYVMWKTDGCKMCHAKMDPVGFGLENYDTAGRYRDFEPDRPDCPIDGVGTLEGVGEFNGPAELSDLMIETGGVDACVATMLYRFTAGRYALRSEDENLVARLVPVAQHGGELSFYDLVVELAASDAFRHRREEVAP
jgi:uncharacterized protein DUF1592/uncharacterized protein DUF1588/uncharacterized protein DUF1595/uncharacterized protein DUF1587